jgi:hypothetical protein
MSPFLRGESDANDERCAVNPPASLQDLCCAELTGEVWWISRLHADIHANKTEAGPDYQPIRKAQMPIAAVYNGATHLWSAKTDYIFGFRDICRQAGE